MSPPDKSAPQLRALIYNRVSSDPHGRGVSVGSQDVENHSFCDRQGWEVAATVTDNDRSASRFAVKERDGYAQVQKALAGGVYGRIDVLVCWESSRAQRDLGDYVQLRDLCTRHGVKLAYKGRVYDMSHGDDRFATGIDALVDERESERLSERAQRGHRTSAAKGRPRGTIPYGYRREYDPHTGYLNAQVPDPETAPVVREIVRRILLGESLHGIAVDLNARNVVTPQAWKDRQAGAQVQRQGWTSSKIRRLLSTESTIGVRTHHGVPHPEATWEPLVRPGQLHDARAVLADPRRRVHTRGVAERHLLSGIAECGVCGAWCRAGLNRGVPSYICAGLGPGTGKGHVTRIQEPLDAFVTELVMGFLEQVGVASLLAKGTEDAAAVEAGREAADLRARLDSFITSAVAGGVSAMALAEIETRLRPQIEDAERRATPSSLPSVLADLIAAEPRRVWHEELGVAERRQVIRFLLRVVVHRAGGRHGSHGFDPSRIEIVWLVGPDAAS